MIYPVSPASDCENIEKLPSERHTSCDVESIRYLGQSRNHLSHLRARKGPAMEARAAREILAFEPRLISFGYTFDAPAASRIEVAFLPPLAGDAERAEPRDGASYCDAPAGWVMRITCIPA